MDNTKFNLKTTRTSRWGRHPMEIITISVFIALAVCISYFAVWQLSVGRTPTLWQASRLQTYAEGDELTYSWSPNVKIVQTGDGEVAIAEGKITVYHVGDHFSFMDDTGRIRDWQIFSIHQLRLREAIDWVDFELYQTPWQLGHFVTFLVDRP